MATSSAGPRRDATACQRPDRTSGLADYGDAVMTISAARHVIAVPDLAASQAFYRDVLGFRIVEVGDPGWRFYQLGEAIIMAGECADAIAPAELGDHSYVADF